MEAKPTMPKLKDLSLFDSCVTLGRFSGGGISTAAELLELMDRYGIAEALVHEYHARYLYPLENGNHRLMDMIKGQTRLHPVWVLEPPRQPGIKAAEKLVDDMLSAGVRTARLRLALKGVLPWVWKDLCSVLEAHRIPCFFDFGSIESTLGELSDNEANALFTIAQSHPDLPIILSHVMGGLGVHPAVMYLLHRVPNMHIDITGILEYWRVAASEVGPDRVLFATGAPFTDPGVLVSNVQYELELTDKEKRMICGDNLRRLIGGVI